MTDGSKLTLFCFVMLIGNDCGHPGDIADGSVAGGFLFNDTVTYNCHSGFSITSGDSHLTCQANFVVIKVCIIRVRISLLLNLHFSNCTHML